MPQFALSFEILLDQADFILRQKERKVGQFLGSNSFMIGKRRLNKRAGKNEHEKRVLVTDLEARESGDIRRVLDGNVGVRSTRRTVHILAARRFARSRFRNGARHVA